MIAAVAATLLRGCADPGVRAEQLGFEWRRDDLPGYARLALFAPASPGEGLVLGCAPKSGAVDVEVTARPQDPALVVLRSGAAWNRYPGVGSQGEDSADWIVRVRLAEIDPVLRAWGDSGALAVQIDHRRFDAPAAFAPAHDFLLLCRLPEGGGRAGAAGSGEEAASPSRPPPR